MRAMLCFVLALVIVTSVEARRIAPPSLPARLSAADVTIVGKVRSVEVKTVEMELFPGDKREVSVAVVQVEERLFGSTVTREIRVAFTPPAGRGGGIPLLAKQEGILFLTKAPSAKGMYVMPNYYDFIDKSGNDEFKSQVDMLRRDGKLLSDPLSSLKSKDADARLATTLMLLNRYGTSVPGMKLEAIPAEESKMLMSNLAEANWAINNPRLGYQLSPRAMFARLGATAADGWTAPAAEKFEEAAKAWLKENAGKFKIQGYIRPKAEPDAEPSR